MIGVRSREESDMRLIFPGMRHGTARILKASYSTWGMGAPVLLPACLLKER